MGKLYGHVKPFVIVGGVVLLVLAALASCSNPLGTANTNKASYSVGYSGNGNTGGTVPSDSNSYVVGATVTVSSSKPTKSGYSFSGWNTQAGGSGTSFKAGSTFSMGDSSVTLYAQWSSNPTYAVTYQANGATGGSVPTDGSTYTSGTSVTVQDNTGSLTLSGYSFVGWNTSSDGTGTTYLAGSSLTMGGADVSLYAKWTAATTYTVTYNSNGATSGTVPADTNNYVSGAAATARSNSGSLAKTGYTFVGWNTNSSGTGTSYAVGGAFSIASSNVVLYAVWTTASTYTVTYACTAYDSGSVPADANSYLSGASVVVLGNTGVLSRSGYAFSGWNTKSDGTGASYSAGSSLTMGSESVTLYAQWASLSYTVTYVANGATGGSVPTDSHAYTMGTTVTVLGNTGSLAKTGYTFLGWSTSASATSAAYAANDTFTMGSSAVILYAVWSANGTVTWTTTDTANYTVTLYGNSAVSFGSAYTFYSSYTGSTSSTYQWYLNGTAIGGATSDSYSVTVTASATAWYTGTNLLTLIVTDGGNGLKYSASKSVTASN